MEFVAGKLNSIFLETVIVKHLNDCAEVIAIVPYCSSTRLFDRCHEAGKRITYYGRLDESVPVTSKVLRWFNSHLTPNYSCYLLRGGLHAKIIWLKGEGVYIGSANLTDRGWIDNIEAGVFIPEEELLAQGITDQLFGFVDFVVENSTPLSKELISLVEELERKRKNIKDEEWIIKKWFEKKCNLPKMPSIASVNKIKSAERQKAKFITEWNATLQLLRNVAYRLRDYRPDWIASNVPDGVHVDQFLHAYYYLKVREGTKQRFDEYFLANRQDPEAALVEQMKWWQQGDYPHESESDFIHNWAPSSRQLMAAGRIESLNQDDFSKLCTQIHAIRDHSIKLSNSFLGVAGKSSPQEEKTRAFGEWLFGRTSLRNKTVLETINYVIYGGELVAVPDRLWTATRDKKWRIEHLGISSLGEMIGWALPEDFPPRNSRTSKALRALGNDIKIY